MAGREPARGDLRETMAEFVDRRWRDPRQVGQDAGAAALAAYGTAIRMGKDLILKTQSEVERYPPGTAAYFATPYTGRGHHTVGRRSRFPAILGGGPVPPVIVESAILRLNPRDTTFGDFYELHYGVDGFYSGGKVPRRFGGGGWSGEKLGWRKFDPLERIWYGTTPTMKAAAGAGVAGAGALVDEAWDEEQAR